MLLIVVRMLYRMDVRLAPGFTLGEGAPELKWGGGGIKIDFS